jgi:outer membrane protein assembly factor BamA
MSGHWWLGWLMLCGVPVLAASDPIGRIEIEGNATTREEVILRELAVGVGEVADPDALEASRQAILDLGLFREVSVAVVTDPDGTQVLRIELREKRYLLPVPRLDASSDKDYSYGAQLRWSNVGGRNHRLNAYIEQSRFENESDRERDDLWRLSYQAPYLFNDRDGLFVSAEQLDRRNPAGFEEHFDRFAIGIQRDLRKDRPRHGWELGLGLLWERQDTSGPAAPDPDGTATALLASARFDAQRFHVYSETGQRLDLQLQAARRGWASDYSYGLWNARYVNAWQYREREHENLRLVLGAGSRAGGPDSRDQFSLGGSGSLRGYEADFLEGDRYYYGAVEYLRPIRWDWLRLLALVEVGGIDDDQAGERSGEPYANLALGVRIRLTWFVDVEIEAGLAYPLRGGDGARFFAGGN